MQPAIMPICISLGWPRNPWLQHGEAVVTISAHAFVCREKPAVVQPEEDLTEPSHWH